MGPSYLPNLTSTRPLWGFLTKCPIRAGHPESINGPTARFDIDNADLTGGGRSSTLSASGRHVGRGRRRVRRLRGQKQLHHAALDPPARVGVPPVSGDHHPRPAACDGGWHRLIRPDRLCDETIRRLRNGPYETAVIQLDRVPRTAKMGSGHLERPPTRCNVASTPTRSQRV